MLFRQQLFINKQKGFTLIELLVGIVVSMLVLGMTYSIFSAQLRLTKSEMSINNLQANTQTALRYLAKKIRNLGYGVTTKVPVPAVLWYDGDEGQSNAGGFSSLNIWPSDNLEYSDALAFYSTNVPTEVKIIGYDVTSQKATLKTQLSNDDVGKLVLFYDTLNQYYKIARIDSVNLPTSDTTVITFSFGWGGNAPDTYNFQGSDANILGDYNLLYVDNNNILRMKTTNANIPLMNNVLSLQVEAGRDTDNDNLIDSWTYNSNDLSSVYEIKGVKIYIVTATSREEKGVSMNVMDKISQLDQNSGGIWSSEVNWDAVLEHFNQVHGTGPGVPRVYSFGCELRNIYTCN